MNKSFLTIYTFLLLCFCSGVVAEAQVRAFPGAEGYGKNATGGRGNGTTGRIAIVTTLADDADNPPEGSFRWALQQGVDKVNYTIGGQTVTVSIARPLTVVFRVSGVINLKADIHTTRSNLTIAGQTAPGDGICFRGATVNLSASTNVIVRYLRFRPGDELGEEVSAFRIENGSRFIIDHCSMSWAIEETTHFSSNDSTTVQWCIISESLYNSIHKKGARGYGTQWGGEYASYHHNLLAHHNSRMPRINGSNANDINALVDYRNNVNYNWCSSGAFYGGEWENTNGKGFCHTNVVNNYFKPGPATSGSYFAAPSLKRDDTTLDGYGKWYFSGNVMEGHDDKTQDNWLGVDVSAVGSAANIRSDEVFVYTDGTIENYDSYTQSATDAYASVLEDAGATLPKRDAHDTRLIKEITGEISIVRYEYYTSDSTETPAKGTSSGIIDTQNNLVSPEDRAAGITAWDVYDSTTVDEAPVDSDSDGMPDDWETAHNLNPSDSTDFKLITSSGYSNLEIYLNELAGDTITMTSSSVVMSSPKIQVYPNPCIDQLTIESSNQIISVDLIDLLGRTVLSSKESDSRIVLSTGALDKGYYIVKATMIDGSIIKSKILKTE